MGIAYTPRRMPGFDRAVLEEIVRRARLGDPLKSFTPTFKQSKFIGAVLERKHSEYYFLAANRAGKTAVGSYIGACFARQVPGFADGPTEGWVVSLDFPMSRDTIQPMYFDNGFGVGAKPFIPDYEIKKWDRQAQILMLKNGSQIAFKSCDSGAAKFQAAGKHWVHNDEVAPKNVDDEIAIRVQAGAKLIRWCTATLLPPEGISGSAHWLYQEVVKPWKSGDKSRHVTNASIYDNPHLLPEEIARLELRYPEGSMTRRIRLGGELLPGISGSLVYSAFNHGTHVATGLEISDNYPILWTWDFNVSPMTSLLCQKRNGKLYVIRELWSEESSIPEMCALFMESIKPSHPVWIYGDATGRARSAHTRQTSYQIILNELTARGYVVKMHVPESNPSEVDRINAMNVALSSHEGKSSVVVDSSCVELIADMEGVIYDKNNKIKKVSLPSDPYHWRTHVSDALGYLVHKEYPIEIVRGHGNTVNIKRVSYGGA